MENKKNERLGIWIPQEIVIDQNLDWPNKVLLSEIYSLCELKQGCFASDRHFGKFIGVGRTAINKRINWLKNMGYINTRNEYVNSVCVGRVITKSSSHRKHTHVPQEDIPSSNEIQGIVLEEDKGSSNENTTNSDTNSDLSIQKLNQNSGESLNTGMPIYQFLNNRLGELALEAVEKSSLGEEIFFYANAATIGLYKNAVTEEEYNIVLPVLKSIIEVEHKLSRK